ncbi:P22 phage major capsid protein family protein [Phenylobacterium sp.]|uniref:P22 phage major capsid protein family protein n=1 Tax=Phenylobacterium sp. TaxID=1871053 RepID=UPI0026283104|nr:P22 phage major capsid protein family protein [Phenylobacterium sp.]
MTNSLLTSTMVTREALRILHQKLRFVGTITRDYDDSFAKTGAKIGDSLKIRLPNQYVSNTGKTLVAQDTTEQSTTLQVGTQRHVGMNFSSADLTMSIDDFSERVIEPAMAVLAAGIEADALSMYKDVYQQVNNTGAAATMATLLNARKRLTDSLAPEEKRFVQLNTTDNVDLVDAFKGQFNAQQTISKQNIEGMQGRTAGFDFYENTLVSNHTRGGADAAYTTDTRTSAIPVSATAVTSLTVASGTGTILKGDVFTIAGIFSVHPESKARTGSLQQFTVTADYAGGGGSISISPSIVTDGAYQNVTIPSGSATAAMTFVGTASAAHGISLAYQKGAFAFATADLLMPKGVDFGAREVFDGISMRLVRQYDINNDNLPCRVDVLYGYKTLRPQLAARMANR